MKNIGLFLFMNALKRYDNTDYEYQSLLKYHHGILTCVIPCDTMWFNKLNDILTLALHARLLFSLITLIYNILQVMLLSNLNRIQIEFPITDNV